MRPQLIHNVIKGFALRKDSSIAINFWGSDDALLNQIEKALRHNNHDVINHQVDLERIKTLAEDNALLIDEETLSKLVAADNAIDIFTHPVKMPEGFPQDKIDDYKMYLGKLFQAMKSGKEKFIQWRLPTEGNATAIDSDTYIEAVQRASMVDYDKLKRMAYSVEQFVTDKKKVRIMAKGTDLTFYISDVKWFKDIGDGDVPAGEIACVPHLADANGHLHVPFVAFQQLTFYNLDFTIKDGVFSTTDDAFNEFLEKFSGDANVLAEFGIGLNGAIQSLIGNQLHDEKKLNTVHLGIGTNAMFNGPNKSDLHFDFVIEPTEVIMDEAYLIKDNAIRLK